MFVQHSISGPCRTQDLIALLKGRWIALAEEGVMKEAHFHPPHLELVIFSVDPHRSQTSLSTFLFGGRREKYWEGWIGEKTEYWGKKEGLIQREEREKMGVTARARKSDCQLT